MGSTDSAGSSNPRRDNGHGPQGGAGVDRTRARRRRRGGAGVAPASKISWLDRLTNAEDDARADATEWAEAASEELPGEQVEAHGGDVDPLQAIEDALRGFPADEIVVLTPNEEATWLEAGLGKNAQERFSVPVAHLVTQ